MTVYAGAWPQVHWPRVSRGGRLVIEVRRQGQSSSPSRPGNTLGHSNAQRPGRSLKADWLDERPTSNGVVWQRVDPAHLGGLRFSATTGGALIAVLTGTLVR